MAGNPFLRLHFSFVKNFSCCSAADKNFLGLAQKVLYIRTGLDFQ